MAKVRVCISLDHKTIRIAKELKINISKISEDALRRVTDVYLEHMKENMITLEDLVKEQIKTDTIIQTEYDRIVREEKQSIKIMRDHVRAAKEAGIPRGQAEMDFGHVFPDTIWENGS